jgi:hypothetical protein
MDVWWQNIEKNIGGSEIVLGIVSVSCEATALLHHMVSIVSI